MYPSAKGAINRSPGSYPLTRVGACQGYWRACHAATIVCARSSVAPVEAGSYRHMFRTAKRLRRLARRLDSVKAEIAQLHELQCLEYRDRMMRLPRYSEDLRLLK